MINGFFGVSVEKLPDVLVVLDYRHKLNDRISVTRIEIAALQRLLHRQPYFWQQLGKTARQIDIHGTP